MAADPTAQTNVSFPGQISGGQFAVGDHNLLITNHGIVVTEGQAGSNRRRCGLRAMPRAWARPSPRLC